MRAESRVILASVEKEKDFELLVPKVRDEGAVTLCYPSVVPGTLTGETPTPA